MSCCLSFLYRIFCCQCSQSSNQTASQPQASTPQVQQAAKVSRVSSVTMPTSEVLQIFNTYNNNSQVLHIEMVNPQFFINEVVLPESSSSAHIGKARSSTTQITTPNELEQQHDQAVQEEVIKNDDGRTIPMIPILDRPVHKEAPVSASSSSQSDGIANPSQGNCLPAKPRENPNLKIQRVHHANEIMKKNQAIHKNHKQGEGRPLQHNRVRSNSAPIRKTENTAATEERPHTPYIPRLIQRYTNEKGEVMTKTVFFMKDAHRTTEHASSVAAFASKDLSKQS